MSTAELKQARAAHMANLERLRDYLPKLKPANAQRAENTMANLMQQVYQIDDQLAAIKQQQVIGAA
jgi:hypothetical protein